MSFFPASSKQDKGDKIEQHTINIRVEQFARWRDGVECIRFLELLSALLKTLREKGRKNEYKKEQKEKTPQTRKTKEKMISGLKKAQEEELTTRGKSRTEKRPEVRDALSAEQCVLPPP